MPKGVGYAKGQKHKMPVHSKEEMNKMMPSEKKKAPKKKKK